MPLKVNAINHRFTTSPINQTTTVGLAFSTLQHTLLTGIGTRHETIHIYANTSNESVEKSGMSEQQNLYAERQMKF